MLPWSDLDAYRAEHRRRNPIPDLAAVPPELANRKQWLMWRYEPGETPKNKPRKMPYYAGGGRRYGDQGSDGERAKLTTYAVAAGAAAKAGFDGIGFAFLPDDGLIGIDLDGMIDPESGEISQRCQDIIAACASYTEYSPSGKGVHIICAGETQTFKSNKVGVEVFCGKQYFTFTAKPWPGAPTEIRALSDDVLRRLRVTVKGSKSPPAPAESPAASHPPPATPGQRPRSMAETVALAEEALAFIDAGDYEQWINVGLACKADLGPITGYMVWDAWSARSEKYAGPEDTRNRWGGFKPEQITLGTVFKLAEQSGWEAPWAKAKARKSRARKPSPDASSPPAEQGGAVPSDPPPAPPSSRAIEPTLPPEDPLQAPAGEIAGPPDRDWEIGLIRKKGDVSSCLANAHLILSHMPEWRGTIAYDQFAERTVYRSRPPFLKDEPESGDWTDHFDVMTAIWLQRKWGVEFSPKSVAQAVEALARDHKFHPVREALEALPPWDGTPRNTEWLSDYLGVERTEYTALVGQFFLRGMIQRVMSPGCKFDYCLVLEGEQGRGKSTVARILSWHWFCDTDLDLNNKDSLLALPGHWVYEIAELGSLMKAEERKQKSFLSRQEDEYRPPYGTRLMKVPRQNVFIGTTNEDEYLKDATGGRRFWPVACGDSFNLEGLRANIEQMFAEALHDFHLGERAYPDDDQQKRLFTPEQRKRGMQEPYDDIMVEWVKLRSSHFTMAEAIMDGLKLTADKITPALCTRLGYVFKRLGCGRFEDRLADDKQDRRPYIPPHLIESYAKRQLVGGKRAPF
jgi:hypothetical protein